MSEVTLQKDESRTALTPGDSPLLKEKDKRFVLLKPFNHNVSTDLSSVLTRQVLVPSALFSKLSQGVKQEHITAEDRSMLQ
ncbi:hypothetical protein F7725_020861 [Dissostichus mawsoni]|uniref:Uncharacterized protein n=1 Tax=Dissostichus mawsoni TaxID=36200 RepID=A0A7J5YFB4_DISMA|nr:hypothetical protein F7725_020861 [Dissostichus mawsoni]